MKVVFIDWLRAGEAISAYCKLNRLEYGRLSGVVISQQDRGTRKVNVGELYATKIFDVNPSNSHVAPVYDFSISGVGLALFRTAACTTQCRSNPVSGGRLPKTGIFQMWAGDYRRFRAKIVQIGSIETDVEFTKGRNWRALIEFLAQQSSVE